MVQYQIEVTYSGGLESEVFCREGMQCGHQSYCMVSEDNGRKMIK
jgi:hypothetical protein